MGECWSKQERNKHEASQGHGMKEYQNSQQFCAVGSSDHPQGAHDLQEGRLGKGPAPSSGAVPLASRYQDATHGYHSSDKEDKLKNKQKKAEKKRKNKKLAPVRESNRHRPTAPVAMDNRQLAYQPMTNENADVHRHEPQPLENVSVKQVSLALAAENNRKIGNQPTKNEDVDVGYHEKQQMMDTRLTRVTEERDQYKEQNSKLQAQLREYEEQLSSLRENDRVTNVAKKNKYKEQCRTLQAQLHENEEQIFRLRKTNSEQIGKLKEEVKKKDTEIVTLLTRLSKMASMQLTDSNPNIADLSDENRPTKLGEKYSELYDNQWTDAFFELVEIHKKDETEAVGFLKDTLVQCHKICKKIGDQNITDYKTCLNNRRDLDEYDRKERMKHFKDDRKQNYIKAMASLEKELYNELGKHRNYPTKEPSGDLKKYVTEAMKICWLMQVQDPPLILEWEFPPDSAFSTNRFKAYTTGGPNIDFIVWPVMYLHKNGPLVCKGVAQGKKAPSNNDDTVQRSNRPSISPPDSNNTSPDQPQTIQEHGSHDTKKGDTKIRPSGNLSKTVYNSRTENKTASGPHSRTISVKL